MQMALDGTLSPEALHAAASDSRVGGQYAALRSCDGAFRAMLSVAQQQQQGYRRHQHEQEQDEDAAETRTADPRALYTQYLHCAGSAVCEPALRSWYACLREARDKKTAFAECKTTRKLLERCMRAKTEDLLRASQPDVFP
jgi:hypothetical protein